jgi:chromosome partitioning protein
VDGRVATIAFCTQKGGTGKTTTTANVGVELGLRAQESGHRILLVDMDFQANLTKRFGLPGDDPERKNMADLLVEQPKVRVEDVIIRDVSPGVDLLPADKVDMRDLDGALVGRTGSDLFLSVALEEVRESYQWILVDTRPALNPTTQQAIHAAAFVVTVHNGDSDSVDGAEEIINFIHRKQRIRWTNARVVAQIWNAYDRRESGFNSAGEANTSSLLVPLLSTRVPDRASIKRANDLGMTIYRYLNGQGELMRTYQSLTDDLLNAIADSLAVPQAETPMGGAA